MEIAGLSNEALNGSYVLYAVEEDFLIVPGVLEEPLSQTGSLTVARTCPDMDFLAVHQNRLWGCSSENHEIYASKLGDPANFHVYAGIASDSYAGHRWHGGGFHGRGRGERHRRVLPGGRRDQGTGHQARQLSDHLHAHQRRDARAAKNRCAWWMARCSTFRPRACAPTTARWRKKFPTSWMAGG